MDDDARAAAWQRIEAALARLDTAARHTADRPAPDARQEADHTAELEALSARLRDEQARHTALRGALRDTLGRIDELIAAHTPAAEGQQA
jgi:hypothetical protein